MDMVTDFHSHILPGMDDGSADVAQSLQMLTLQNRQRIRRVVATPHFYPRYEQPDQFLLRREQAQKALLEALGENSGLPQLLLGAEVYYFRGISESEWLQDLAIEGTDTVLIEMPVGPWSDAMYRELAQIREKRGLIPIIAHVDRYISPLHTRGIPRILQQLPVLVQANASFFLGGARGAMAMKMLKQDQIQLLGSDCHNLTDRTPNLGEAVRRIEKKLGPEALARIRGWEQTVISNG